MSGNKCIFCNRPTDSLGLTVCHLCAGRNPDVGLAKQANPIYDDPYNRKRIDEVLGAGSAVAQGIIGRVSVKRDNMPNVKSILEERGKRYGEFKNHADISQRLKKLVNIYGEKLNSTHREALEMIMHKVARILNGDPNYDDSWIDIAGYAQLVADDLKKLSD